MRRIREKKDTVDDPHSQRVLTSVIKWKDKMDGGKKASNIQEIQYIAVIILSLLSLYCDYISQCGLRTHIQLHLMPNEEKIPVQIQQQKSISQSNREVRIAAIRSGA